MKKRGAVEVVCPTVHYCICGIQFTYTMLHCHVMTVTLLLSLKCAATILHPVWYTTIILYFIAGIQIQMILVHARKIMIRHMRRMHTAHVSAHARVNLSCVSYSAAPTMSRQYVSVIIHYHGWMYEYAKQQCKVMCTESDNVWTVNQRNWYEVKRSCECECEWWILTESMRLWRWIWVTQRDVQREAVKTRFI